MRVGFGHDVHRLIEGRPLILGGIHVPFDRGLEGHSDADVLLHAVTDALLGALAMGDIGLLFPDTDARWKDADSRLLLAEVVDRIHAAGWCVENVDTTVAMQRPKLRPHIDSMRDAIAGILHVTSDRVSVKATTTERLGFVGREEGVAAWAACMLRENVPRVGGAP